MRRQLLCRTGSLLSTGELRCITTGSNTQTQTIPHDFTSTNRSKTDAADEELLKNFNKSTASSSFNNSYSQSGTPTRAGTEAAIASMRLRRIAQAEELERDREEMLQSQYHLNKNEQVPTASSSTTGPSKPSDDEVKAWKAQRNAEDAAAVTKKQRMARDAFVRDILGTPPPSAQSSTTPTTESNSTTPTGTSSSRRFSSSPLFKTASFTTSTAANPNPSTDSKYKRFDSDGKTVADDSPRIDPQADQQINEYPEETAERLKAAAAKYGNTLDTNYGVADLDYNGRKLMITIGFCAILFVFLPLYVDPFGTLGEERGGKGFNEKNAIRKQQEKNMAKAASAKKRKDDDNDSEEDDDFYNITSTLSSRKSQNSTEGGSATDRVTDSNSAPLFSSLNPLIIFASYANWYLAVLRNIGEAREDMAAGSEADKVSRDRIKEAQTVLAKVRKGDSQEKFI